MLQSNAQSPFSRRSFLRSAAMVTGAAACSGYLVAEEPSSGSNAPIQEFLQHFGYEEISFEPGLEDDQLHRTIGVLMNLSDDELLKPYRLRAGKPAPGRSIGGWYDADAFAPGHAFGQWISGFSRYSAITGDGASREKVASLIRGFSAIHDTSGKFFANNRFPAYTLEKLNCGLIDAHTFAHDPRALETLSQLTDAALPYLPEKALSRADQEGRPHKDRSYTYDESYTLPENYFLAWQRSGDTRYRDLAIRFLYNEEFFAPLAQGENVLPGLHAYSHLNAMNSATQAYFALKEPKYLRAAVNGFRFVQEQSYATGGWGPDERFVIPGHGNLAKSLSTTHNSFETPCGAYGHFKLTRSLLIATKDARYGDSMEAVMFNTVLGAKPLGQDGRAFYYSDYNPAGQKQFARDKWPCCSGTLPQVAADYRISTYLRDGNSLYVNLYVPSTLTWQMDSGRVVVQQQTDYPLGNTVKVSVRSTRRRPFAIYLRVPAWAGDGATISVNDEICHVPVRGGTFSRIERTWGSNDHVELVLPMQVRLQQVDPETSSMVALMRGPLVLFPMAPGSGPFREAELRKARQTSRDEWIVPSVSGDVRFRPFPSIHEEPYSTYAALT